MVSTNMNFLGKILTFKMFFIGVFLFDLVDGKFLTSDDRNTYFTTVGGRAPKEFDLLNWLFSPQSQTESRPNITSNEALVTPSTNLPPESLILGPLEFSNVQNSSLKRIRLSPGLEKAFRNEIFRYNLRQEEKQAKDQSEKIMEEKERKNVVVKRFARSTELLRESILKRQGLGLAAGLTQQQLFFLQQQQQQQQEAAALLLQQQMLSTLQNQRYNGLNQRRKSNFYDDYDDESESEEDDDFDSNEFMSFPMRQGFMMPIMPGFNGKK